MSSPDIMPAPDQMPEASVVAALARVTILPPEDPAKVRERDNVPPPEIHGPRPMQEYPMLSAGSHGGYDRQLVIGRKAPSGSAALAVNHY